MTYLELVAAVGSVPMDIACMYFNGRLTEREMKNVIPLLRYFSRTPKSTISGMFLSAK